MKKLLLACSVAAFALFTACSDDDDSSSVCAELSKSCLKGTWTLTSLTGATYGSYDPNQLVFSGSKFTYTPSSDDSDHTYCVGYTLSGTYELSGTDEIIFHAGKDGSTTLTGLCFLDSVGTASIADDGVTRTLTLSGTGGYSLFVPNDEGAVTEVYTRE